MRPQGSAAELERRRRRAIRLLEDGQSLAAVARTVGAAVSAVWQWRATFRRKGAAGLAAKPVPGRPRKLTAAQRRRLPRLLARGARAHGYATDLWTTRRIATVIDEHFGVTYHPAHVGRLLAQLGWSCQKPERRAVERDEPAIARWKRTRWVALKKKPAARARTWRSSTRADSC
jgi:transposase